MLDTTFKAAFLVGLVAEEVIRFPHRMRNKRDKREQKIIDGRSTTPLEIVVSTLGFAGMEIVPLFYFFTTWLDFADYPLPGWLGPAGIAVFALGLWVLWRAHVDLGRNWSPTLEIVQRHALVTGGVYRYLRHPIYASLLLFGIAQLLLLPNWIAGPGGLIAFAVVYLLRIPQEEKMMLEHFGEEYESYMRCTGGVVPRFGA